MESRRRIDFRKVFSLIYVLAFGVYLTIGLQPANAKNYEISGNLVIPSINLVSDITSLALSDHKLDTPDTIVGSYSKYSGKTLLIGHSTTVFKDLRQVNTGDTIFYNGKGYKIANTEILAKSQIDMNRVLARTSSNTIIIMTCAGEILDSGDATHRFIVTAVEI